ncbi:lysoplasmalogenase [Rhizobium sp. XQZ8]|uniref:lysoplasmalogenase family protein n=1 Tax=Rhizobium populisoli TaxID=2859785 RepID=UPI001CA3215F|nr:lysoplasmalogenase family protein [Rhizobium populisoli]MBW6423850.1 lysoplasmalogenase [Rhizobium populisoli]
MSIFLSVVLVASVLLALVYFRWLEKPASHPRTVLKTLPVLLLSGYALAMHAPLLATALALAALGDLCLAYDGEPSFIAGLLAFLLSHITYVALFWPHADLALILASPARYAFAWFFVMLAGLLLFILWRPAGKLALPVAVYAMAIVAMAVSALAVRPVMPGVAATLFLLSDTALGLQCFVVKPSDPMAKRLKPFVWGTYFTAQLIFTLAIAGMPRF